MNTTHRTVAVGVFEDQTAAQEAIAKLRSAGFHYDDVGVVAPGDDEMQRTSRTDAHDEEGSEAETGAMAGAATGLGIGGLWGIGIAAGMLPAIGPVIAGGTLAAILASAATAAAAGGLIGALVGWGIPEEDAEYYQDQVREGNTLVTVRAGDRYDEAQQLLYEFGAYDVHRRDQDEGTIGRLERSTQAEDDRSIELREERLRAAPETTTGEVAVRKEVRTERQHIDVPLEKEEVVIEHRQDQPHPARGPVEESEEIRIPVKEQRARVEKETVSKGDVRIGKQTTHETERVAADVRKEEFDVERKGAARRP